MFWTEDVKRGLQEKYIKCLSLTELASDYNLKNDINHNLTINYLLDLLNNKLTKRAKKDLLMSGSFTFDEYDIKSMDIKVHPYSLKFFIDGANAMINSFSVRQ